MNSALEVAGVSVSRGVSEDLGQRLSELAAEPAVSGVVPGAHHLDDVPLGFTHLRAGSRMSKPGATPALPLAWL